MQNNIKFVDFTNTMTIGTYQEQIERSRQTKEADLEYYGLQYLAIGILFLN